MCNNLGEVNKMAYSSGPVEALKIWVCRILLPQSSKAFVHSHDSGVVSTGLTGSVKPVNFKVEVLEGVSKTMWTQFWPILTHPSTPGGQLA